MNVRRIKRHGNRACWLTPRVSVVRLLAPPYGADTVWCMNQDMTPPEGTNDTPAAPMAPPPPAYQAPQPQFAPPAPVPPQNYYAQPYPAAGYGTMPESKRSTAGIFALLLGGIGVHKFYLGYTTEGILQILLTIFTCGLGGIVPMIEGIMYLTKSDQEFVTTYQVNRKGWF